MIFCCGEALIDMLPRRLPGGEDVFLPVAGGAVFNTAITLGRLGAPVGFVSGISRDMFGRQLIAALEASDVDSGYCILSNRPTTLAFVRLVDGDAQYTFVDENSAGRMVQTSDLPELPADVDAMHFGAISLIAEPCGSTYETLMTRYAANTVVSLDPNIRAGFVSDEKAYRSRIARMSVLADIIKISDEDLDWIAKDRSREQVIDEMLLTGCSVVVLTRGAGGLQVHTRQGVATLPADSVEVVDTIGAGDSFNGGFLEGLRRNGLLSKSALREITPDALRPALQLAVRVAGMTVSRAGANPPWHHELSRSEQ